MLRCVCVPAVNIFVIISGYFLCMSDRRGIGKPLNLLTQSSLYKTGIFMLEAMRGNAVFSVRDVIWNLTPHDYFVILYVALYLTTPYVNKVIRSLSRREYATMLRVFIMLFSVWNIAADVLVNFLGKGDDIGFCTSTIGLRGAQYGYTIVNFLLVYMIGAYIRLHGVPLSGRKSAVGFIACTVVLYVLTVIDGKSAGSYARMILGYYNPLVIAQAAFALLLFSRLRFRSRFVNEIAGAAFTCYLIQGCFFPHLRIERFANAAPALMLAHVGICLVLIYAVSYIVHKVYGLVSGRVFAALDRRAVPYWDH